MKHYLLLAGITLFLAGTLKAQPLLLTTPPDAHAAGMGYSGVAENSDANSIYWNAAKLAFADSRMEISFSYQLLGNYYHDKAFCSGLAAYYRPDSSSAIAFSARYLSEGSTVLFWPNNALYRSYQPTEKAFDIAYARKLGRSFSASLTARLGNTDPDGLPYEHLKNYFAMDAGLYYHSRAFLFLEQPARFMAGLALANIGPKPRYLDFNPDLPLPTLLRPGAALTVSPGRKHRITAQGQIEAMFNDFRQELIFGGGIEYAYGNFLALRIGYSYSSYWTRWVTFGAGVHVKQFRADIGYVARAWGFPNEGILMFTLSADLNKINH